MHKFGQNAEMTYLCAVSQIGQWEIPKTQKRVGVQKNVINFSKKDTNYEKDYSYGCYGSRYNDRKRTGLDGR